MGEGDGGSERVAFRMRLKPGAAAEYRARHDALWPELGALLREAGISNYSIWLDPETDALFAILTRAADHAMDALPERELMRRWWAHMAPLMDVNADDSPVVVPLERVFLLD